MDGEASITSETSVKSTTVTGCERGSDAFKKSWSLVPEPHRDAGTKAADHMELTMLGGRPASQGKGWMPLYRRPRSPSVLGTLPKRASAPVMLGNLPEEYSGWPVECQNHVERACAHTPCCGWVRTCLAAWAVRVAPQPAVLARCLGNNYRFTERDGRQARQLETKLGAIAHTRHKARLRYAKRT
jgi:hypothetical protein